MCAIVDFGAGAAGTEFGCSVAAVHVMHHCRHQTAHPSVALARSQCCRAMATHFCCCFASVAETAGEIGRASRIRKPGVVETRPQYDPTTIASVRAYACD
eukprot:m.699596 g.699596  ORF g.699596 m.699596 type:complete len:100 (-) comp22905_c1_seq10:2443-2742(-)